MAIKKTPLLETNGFKYFKNFLFGWGASVVIIGAWAKLTHQPWANVALTVGLMTEALIFAISGIVPPVKDYYWEKLYPGLDEAGGEEFNLIPEGSDIDVTGNGLKRGLAGGVGGGSGSTAALDKMLDEAKIDQLSINRLGDNLKKLSDNVNSMASVTNTQVATEEFAAQTQKATEQLKEYTKQTIESLSAQSKQTSDAMNALTQNLDNLSKVYGNMLSAMRS